MQWLRERTRRLYLETYFAKVNWNAHLVPLVQRVESEFSDELKMAGLKTPHLSLLSKDVRSGMYEEQKEELWGDSITISFGCRPVPGIPVVRVKTRTRVLSEDQSTLVFSQSVSGSVVALIYPPSSDVAKPLKPYYMVRHWRNPGEVNERDVRHLLKLATKVDVFCGSYVYPNREGERLLVKLQVRDAVIADGGSPIWVNLMYILRFAGGVLRLYGVGKPSVGG